MARLCRMEGIDLGKTVAIGDYYNDLSLIRAAGYGVFTQNAPEELKKEADLVVSDNDHDAVAEVITYVMNHREDLF